MMLSSRRLVLVALNLVLGAAIYIEWSGEELVEGPGQITASVGRPAPEHTATPAEDATGTADPKPLFRIRLPEPVAAPETIPTSTASSVPNFRLAGVVWGEAEKVAIVQMAEDGKHRRLRIGDAIGDWSLRELSTRTALLEAGSIKVELRLTAGQVQ